MVVEIIFPSGFRITPQSWVAPKAASGRIVMPNHRKILFLVLDVPVDNSVVFLETMAGFARSSTNEMTKLQRLRKPVILRRTTSPPISFV
jgi:hypothetical protein